jgi:hypothetical protein
MSRYALTTARERSVERLWHALQAACAPTGDGLYEGLDWLHGALKRRKH